MRKIIKARWAIFAVWMIATILLTAFQPDVNSILRLKGADAVSKDSSSVVASSILKKMEVAKGSDDIIVFYDKNKISESEMTQISDGVKAISDNRAELGVNKLIDPFSMPQAKASLISKDGTTLMVSFKLDKKSREIDAIKKQFDSKLSKVNVEYYYSGEDFINDEYQQTAQAGVEKSAGLTVVFILVVLILMFRSVITPLISLLAVAFAYLCSMGIAAQLIDKCGFPVTSLTQMLLILILFGVGTDYNILLFNRFKEELSKGFSIDDAIVNTYQTAGKTIAFSILTVFIAFLSLGFSESPIYQSGVVVVIGVAVLLLEIVTLTPLAMKVLGNKLFWPSKKTSGHKESKVWAKTATLATKHPIVSVAVVLLMILPMVFSYQAKLNFNTIGELGASHPSTKAFGLVSEKFGRGQAMPATVVIESDKALDNSAALSVIESLTERLKGIDGVAQVASVTQPQAKKIDNFYINSQMKTVTGSSASSQAGAKANKIFYIPDQALKSPNFKPVVDMFMSADRTITKLTVILEDDPYSENALNTIKKLGETVTAALKGTVIANATSGVAGPSSYTYDLNSVLSRDLNKTAVIVIIGVFIVLLIVTRSFWAPVCITASLVGAYFAAMFILNFVFLNLLGYEGVSSFVPFFSFIVIVSLGVDYSIFLMMRFKEYPHMAAKEAIVLASKHIGGVIMSAGVILAGTFATLMPSGMLLMTELAIAVMTGLAVLCFILLPIFLPAMIALPDTIAHLWSKNKNGNDSGLDKKIA